MSDSDGERVVVCIFVTCAAEYLILHDVSAEYSTCSILFCASRSSFRALLFNCYNSNQQMHSVLLKLHQHY